MVLVLVGVPAAQAAPVTPDITCGQSITTSVVLNTNLSCPGTIFDIDNNTPTGTTVDLGGHTVTSALRSGPAIRIIDAPTDETITGGTIKNAFVTVDDVQGANLYFINFTGSNAGYVGVSDFGTYVEQSSFTNGASVFTEQGVGDTIGNDRFVNGPPGAQAIGFDESNTLADNDVISGYGTGINLTGSDSEAEIENTTISGVHGDGIVVAGQTAAEVPGFLANNTITHNAGDGIVLEDGAGIAGDGVSGLPTNLSVTYNTTNNNSYDGIHVDPATHGIVVLGENVILANNTANNNGNLGIEAVNRGGVPPVTTTDQGGNLAKGNGQKVQCTNVRCAK
jgi:hypothetical protein